MTRYILIVFALLLLNAAACRRLYESARQEYRRELPNGYMLVKANSDDIEIAAPLNHHHETHHKNGIAIGNFVQSIAIINNIVVGEVVVPPNSASTGAGGRAGLFILNTLTNVAERGLLQDEWEVSLRNKGIDPAMIQLIDPKNL